METKRKISRSIAVLFAALLAGAVALPLLAQGDLTGSVAVTVKDPDGGALSGVELTLKSAALTFTGVTGDRGQYRFLVVPAGTYELRASRSNFAPAALSGLSVRFGETYNAALVLKPGGFKEEVTVTAAPPQVDTTQSATSETLDQQFVQDIPLPNRNFEDLVNLLPGVADGRVRGSRSTSTGFRIDGASNVDPYNSGVAITFSQHAVDRFEMVPNGFEPRYGEFSGGVVNVTTRSGSNTSQGHLGYYFRDDSFVAKPPVSYPNQEHEKAPDTRRFFEAAMGGPITTDRLHYFGAFEYRYSDVGDVFAVRTSKTDSYLGSFKVDYTPRAEDQWTFFGATNLNRTANTIASKFIAPEFNANERNNRYLFNGQQNHIFSGNAFLESQLSFYDASRSLLRSDPNAHVTLYTFTPQGTFTSGRYSSDSRRSLDRARLTEALSWYVNRHEMRFGADLGHLSTRLNQDIGPTRFDFRQLGNALALHYDFDPVRYRQSGFEGAAYAQDKWLVTSAVTLDFGARLEYQKITGNTDVAPRLGIAWDATGDARTKVYANWGTYVERVYDRYLEWSSQPGGRYFFVFKPTGDLADGTEVPGGTFGYRVRGDNSTPYSNAWTVGAERLIGQDLRLAVAYTDKDLRNQLLTYYISNYPQDWYEFRADGDGRYKGVELTTTKRFFHNSEARASYTWSRQTGMGSFLGTFYGPTQIPPVNSIEDSDRTHVAKLSGFSRLPWGFIVSGSYRYASGAPYSVVTYDQNGNPLYVGQRNSRRMPAIQSLDLSLQKTFSLGRTDMALVAEAFNLTNHENVTAVTTSVTNPGTPTAFDVSRIFQMGIKVDF
ncbi:MAG TPA: TonB-dependent receptor [Thermoanaerobaculia bacterium]|jgi:hypothetical protein|nr:TonB-dependent receptor [Thermoanaerobaculia bacterium]